MVAFSEKKIDDRSIGARLREKRLERGETLKDVEKATRVAVKFLKAIEADEFAKLPEPVYARNFIRAIARHYRLDEGPLIESMLRERVAVTGVEEISRLPTGIMGRTFRATPLAIKSGLAMLAFIGVIAYFGVSVHRILKPPKLVVHSPHDSQVFEGGPVVLIGETEPEVELTVNQESVAIEMDGSFSETLTLPDGVSILRIAARKKHSKEQELYLRVVVRDDEPADGEEPPDSNAPEEQMEEGDDGQTVAKK